MTCRRAVIWLVVAASVTAGAVVAAADSRLDVDLERYRVPGGSAHVAVRAYHEGTRPRDARAPLADTTLLLLPRSDALLARLAAIKSGARASLQRYRTAVVDVRRAQDDFVESVVQAGAEPLVRRAVVDAVGTATLRDVPAGPWILLAWRSVFVNKPSGSASQRERRIYTLSPPLDGFRDVNVWVRELTLESGGQETVELTDRNVWFSGVEEVSRTGPAR